jgi:hypothetical protein
MKSDRELMQQALDAFESGRAADRAEAMTALRAALVTAQRREWVGLTDEDIEAIENEYIVDYRIPAGCAWNFARDIEAKLKEKNT